MSHRTISQLVFLVLALVYFVSGAKAEGGGEYVLGSGDIIRITVFQNPDLTTETRVSETGAITFPLVGNVEVGGLTVPAAENRLAEQLRSGGFVLQPQVGILPLQMRGNQVAVLGHVNRPGRYPLETFNMRLTDMLANAGGVAAAGGDQLVLIGVRDGKSVRMEIDVPSLFQKGDMSADVTLAGGDVIYVNRAPMFYIYGEVQRPGAFRLERDMTVMQALATGGGTTSRGTVKGLQIHRRDEIGRVSVIEPRMNDPLRTDDVIFVQESLF